MLTLPHANSQVLRLKVCVRSFRILTAIACGLVVSMSVSVHSQQVAETAEIASPRSSPQSLDQQLQLLKKEALKLNRDLFILKEELQFPANTQVAVFMSVDAGEFFKLDAVNIKLDNKEVANHLYTEKQLDALQRGGIQKLHMGNIKAGDHELVAVFTGRGPKGRDFRRATAYEFSKGSDAKYLELQIVDSDKTNQPEFSVKEWE